MNQRIVKELSELVEAGVITPEISENIRGYFESKRTPSSNRLTLVFSILGATLVGLGIILIIAHNWDNLGKSVKTFFAFLPLLIGQVLCGYTILKKKENAGWREASGVFLFFAVGACISLISQIYNIEGDLGPFMMTWMLLCLPLIYLMPSSMVSLLYIGGITMYAGETGHGRWDEPPYYYILLLFAALPHYYQLWKTKRESNFFNFHSWVISGSLIFSLGTFSDGAEEFLWLAYIGLFCSMFLLGTSGYYKAKRMIANPFRLLGALGMIICFLILSFEEVWEDISTNSVVFDSIYIYPETWLTVLFLILSGYLFSLEKRYSDKLFVNPLHLAFAIFLFIFVMGMITPFIGMALTNILLLLAGIYYIHKGGIEDHLGFLNMGLLIITVLVLSRFFDTDMSFVVRGVLFVALGAGFFLANRRLLQKRRAQEEIESV